jgi:hypothetical protein
MFLMSSQVKKFSQCELRDKKHQYFSIVSLPTDSVFVDHAVVACLDDSLPTDWKGSASVLHKPFSSSLESVYP